MPLFLYLFVAVQIPKSFLVISRDSVANSSQNRRALDQSFHKMRCFCDFLKLIGRYYSQNVYIGVNFKLFSKYLIFQEFSQKVGEKTFNY